MTSITKSLITSAAAVLLLAAAPSFAATIAAASAAAAASQVPVPQGTATTINLRSLRYARRTQCQQQAATQGLQGETEKVFMYKCLQK